MSHNSRSTRFLPTCLPCSLLTCLFSSLDLTKFVYPRTKRARELIQLLSNHDVAASVHTLILRRILQYSQSTLFCKIVNCLPRIRNFTLDCSRETHRLQTFSMPKKVFLAIQALCTSPNLTTLDLSHIGSLPITFITACPNLRCLRLELVEFNVIFFIWLL